MSSPTIRRRILVTGATGKQGGATLQALINHPPPYELEILALTRNPNSRSAQALSQKPHVTIIGGDLDDIEPVFRRAGGIGSVWGVFSAQPLEFAKDPSQRNEVRQGRALIDASIKYGVQHFVQSTVDRGGVESDKNPTPVNHFASKHIIEIYLKEQTQNSDMTYTILRPVAFMDMLTPDFGGRVFASFWATLKDKPLQVIATRDIGVFAAQAFSAPDTDEYKNAAISLAGDELTFAEANEVFWSVVHRPMPVTSGLVVRVLALLTPELATMFQWFADPGYQVDVRRCHKLNAEMTNLATWLKEESRFG